MDSSENMSETFGAKFFLHIVLTLTHGCSAFRVFRLKNNNYRSIDAM